MSTSRGVAIVRHLGGELTQLASGVVVGEPAGNPLEQVDAG
jgi:hypothetical protein